MSKKVTYIMTVQAYKVIARTGKKDEQRFKIMDLNGKCEIVNLEDLKTLWFKGLIVNVQMHKGGKVVVYWKHSNRGSNPKTGRLYKTINGEIICRNYVEKVPSINERLKAFEVIVDYKRRMLVAGRDDGIVYGIGEDGRILACDCKNRIAKEIHIPRIVDGFKVGSFSGRPIQTIVWDNQKGIPVNLDDAFCDIGQQSLCLKLSNPQEVVSMNRTFYSCSDLRSVTLDGFDWQKVTSTVEMFAESQRLEKVDYGIKSNKPMILRNTQGMFRGCRSLESADFLDFIQTSCISDMSYMYKDSGISGNILLDSKKFPKLKNLDYTFESCKNLKRFVMQGSFSYLESMKDTCVLCSDIEYVSLAGQRLPKLRVMSEAFLCEKLKEIDISGINFQSLQDAGQFVSGCHELRKVNLEGQYFPSLMYMTSWFYGNSSLEKIEFTPQRLDKLETVFMLADGATKLKSINWQDLVTPRLRLFGGNFTKVPGIKVLKFDESFSNSDSDEKQCKGILQGQNIRLLIMPGFQLSKMKNIQTTANLKSDLYGFQISERDAHIIERLSKAKIGLDLKDLGLKRIKLSKDIVAKALQVYGNSKDNLSLLQEAATRNGQNQLQKEGHGELPTLIFKDYVITSEDLNIAAGVETGRSVYRV